jgi:hypothetical protein
MRGWPFSMGAEGTWTNIAGILMMAIANLNR